MTEVKENGEDSKAASDSVELGMKEKMVEDEGQMLEDEEMSEERVVEENEANGQTSIEDTKNGDEEGPECENNVDGLNEKEDDPNDSEHVSGDMQSKNPVSDNYVDHDVEVDGKNPERNDESSGRTHDEQRSLVISKDVIVKCENGTERDATLGGSPVADVEDMAIEVNVKENTTESQMLICKIEKINDASVPMESTPRTQTIMFDEALEGNESGTEEEQSAFIRDLESLLREKNLEFKVPKFYGVPVNLLKLWRSVIKLGGYDKVTACKLWRQVGESFNPPKTCTTVSFTFRIFYEKALLEYERHKINGGEIDITPTVTEPVSTAVNIQASGSGRARRDAAARAMQGWHSQRLLGNGEASDIVIKDKGSNPLKSREKQLKNIGGQKQKKPMVEPPVKVSRSKLIKGPSDTAVPVVDVGPAADWVKINVRTTKDCYEVYALVPGLLREEVRVQSDPAGRLVISGEPEHPDNPWGVTPFRKVVSLPSRIDPHQTSAVVTLHGQLFVRVPFEQSD